MTCYRLPPDRTTSAIVNRQNNVRFTFDGQSYRGFEGDTLASALSANGVRLLARSFKYHRPRGLFSAGAEEPNALVTVGDGAKREPNARATMVELFDGLSATSQNRWPSLDHDFGAINGLFGSLLSAGFYYKTFMGPSQDAWMIYEHFIRKAAGMGAGSFDPDPDHYEHTSAHCDVLVVGSGPAGLSAASQAAQAGARVVLAEELPYFGGSLIGDFASINTLDAPAWAHSEIDKMRDLQQVTLLPRTTVYGTFDGMTFAAVERLTDHLPEAEASGARARHWTIRARQVVLASGSIDRPITFPGNDLPGVMLLSGVRSMAVKYGVAMGRKIAVFANHDGAYAAIADLSRVGVQITTVIDPRRDVPIEQAEAVRRAGAELIKGAIVCGTGGGKALKSIQIARWNGRDVASGSWGIECDCLAVSGGTTPLIHLASQAGMKPVFDDKHAAFIMPKSMPDGWHIAGAAGTPIALLDTIKSGARVGNVAVKALGLTVKRTPSYAVSNHDLGLEPTNLHPLWEVPKPKNGSTQKSFVDLQHDVTADDIRLARLEGFQAAEHLKRYTTLGMAADQGKTSNVNGMAIMADALSVPIETVGTTRFRPPYAPISLGAIAGETVREHLQPLRKTPMHDWHLKNNAEMIDVGLWQRPRVYYQGTETMEEAYIREARAVRQAVGLCDVSTLGKIDVQGPDAAEFLNRLYTNGFSKLPVGKARYGLMLRTDGLLFDDGTTWRLGETQFLTTTTTGNAAAVMAHMEYCLSVLWPDLKVRVTSVTDEWASASLAGPKARNVLSKVTDEDVSDIALPFMGVRTLKISGIECLVARLSFSGELAFEVFWPAAHGDDIWRILMDAGSAFGITAYGLEALGTLRIEKGHIAGPEMDGRVTVDDLGLSAMCSTKKPYMGVILKDRVALQAEDRLQLVGLVGKSTFPLVTGAHLVRGETLEKAGASEGHVTSPTYSPVLERYITLGLLKNGRARHGETLYVTNPLGGTHLAVEVVDPVFYDPSGSKMRD